ncbi:MAG: DUF177 domain-containing protein [Polyangiaceae bacterium]|nr:DUF177 domain-containing protein [Polyangiaceae bacterium]
MVVPANDVDASGIGLDVELPAAWVTAIGEEAQARGTGVGKLTARLSRTGRADIVVRGRVKAEVEVPCARCLTPVPVSIDTEIALLLKPRPQAHESQKGTMAKANGKPAAPAKSGQGTASSKAKRKEAEYEFTSEEADEDTYDGERVVLDPFVREAILLELPSFPLCSEACPGIGDAASEGLPGLRPGSPAAAPTEGRSGPARPNPFEALRHLLGDSASNDGSGEPVRRPSAAEVRRAARARSRAKPKMKSSLASRTKK